VPVDDASTEGEHGTDRPRRHSPRFGACPFEPPMSTHAITNLAHPRLETQRRRAPKPAVRGGDRLRLAGRQQTAVIPIRATGP
jgi:hypothetical protein